jgi:hypothetical protein
MADTKVKNAKRIADALDSLIAEIKAPESMRRFGQLAADMIKLRTRLGSGVAKDGSEKQKLKPLSKTYIEVRKGNLAFKTSPSTGKPIPFKPDANGAKMTLSNQTSPSKSNLTRSGQLLDSEGVTSVGYGTVSVGPSGQRTDRKSNEDVAKYVTDAGRPFNHLSKTELKRLQEAVKKELRDRIKRVLTNR